MYPKLKAALAARGASPATVAKYLALADMLQQDEDGVLDIITNTERTMKAADAAGVRYKAARPAPRQLSMAEIIDGAIGPCRPR